MNSEARSKQNGVTTPELNDLIIDSIQEIKGENVLKLDLRHIDGAPVDYFIICEGNSSTQIKSISDNIYKRLKREALTLPHSQEGVKNARWICLDYFTTVVHVFYPETRRYYEIEDLWSDAGITKY